MLDDHQSVSKSMSAPVLGMFLAVAIGAGSAIGILTKPDYALRAFVVPWYFPPVWLMAPVLLTIYIASALACWRLWLAINEEGTPRILLGCGMQLGLNLLWSLLLFVLKFQLLALFAIVLAFILSISAATKQPRRDATLSFALKLSAAGLFYLVCLSVAIVYLNM